MHTSIASNHIVKYVLTTTIPVIAALALAPAPVLGADYYDGFESPVLNPFWTAIQESGTVAVGLAPAFGGSGGARFVSTSTSQQKYIALDHQFAEPVYGRVSVRVLDTGADVSSSNYIWLNLNHTAQQKRSDILVFDHDEGENNGGEYYYRNQQDWSVPPTRSDLDRTSGWHYWEIEMRPDFSAVRIDGTVVSTSNSGVPFDRITMGISGPNWRPAWTASFDEFEFVEFVPCIGDLDNDRAVSLPDLTMLLGAFGATVAPGSGPDLTGDGLVGLDDLTILLGRFGATCE